MADLTNAIAVGPVAAPLAPVGTAAGTQSAASGNTGFQALLERLQQLAKGPATPKVDSADDLSEALRAAESSFTTAMDLRRQLEEAFRRHAP